MTDIKIECSNTEGETVKTTNIEVSGVEFGVDDLMKTILGKLKKEDISADNGLEIKVKYFDESIGKLSKTSNGDWIDLKSAEDVSLAKGEFKLIPLGIGMILPDGYEAHVVPRSSTFKTWGIIQTNHIGIIDNSYSGDNDQWKFPAYATRDTEIKKGDRICQFRIEKNQPEFKITTVDRLDDKDRGGIGSTGIK